MGWKEWDKEPIKFGIWMHKKTGKLAWAYPSDNPNRDWEIDKGVIKNHPLFRIKQRIVAEGTGQFFFNRQLRAYELIEEITYVPEVHDSNRCEPHSGGPIAANS